MDRGSRGRERAAPLRPLEPGLTLGSYAGVGAELALFAAFAFVDGDAVGAASEKPRAVTGS